MTISPVRDVVHYWRPEGLPGVEVLSESGSTRCCRFVFDAYTFAAAPQIHATARYRRVQYTLLNGAVHVGEPGEVYATTRQHRPCTIQVVRVDPTIVDAFARELGIHTGPHFRVSHVRDPAVFQALQALYATLTASSSLLAQQTTLATTLHLILRRYAETQPARAALPVALSAVARARDYLHAHWQAHVSLHDLAQAAGLSPCHLADSFRRALSLPPHAYQTHLRLAHAQRLLARGEAIAEVARATGFADQAHLTRHFRRAFGTTPSVYAKHRKIVQDRGAHFDAQYAE